ncbi:ABC transporter ATP-binding protein [Sulfitobacter sabulilitoris]|uniref:ABC transporter ATP-binding protein n=1 Tax=Sulfitobacter sabulilitoris TaxID=2562655 RepID=A0A5S3P888_9RHOB|nr:ABC transporter ATP-binding protein [Sulfitobacter sabulilitoris]TMM49582.1 ABC transporter ATP-binding protein [Sulfitobacter sabulilitoris]
MSQSVLDVRDVQKSFGAVTAAQDISVSVPEGAVYSLIGTNGAGKTTFVNMVTGYIKPDSGSITFGGRNITGLAPRQITRLGIHRSFQIAQLCNELTVEENMLVAGAIHASGRPSFLRSAHDARARERAVATLERFRIAEHRHRLIPELSGGVKKLLDIAMAMAGDTKVMLLDEPTSGVAADEKFPIMDLVIEALRAEGVTVIFVEHDMDIVTRYSERVLAFYDGRIIADDAPDEVLSDADVRRYVTGAPA